jgi:hypothetical protein
LQAGIILAEQDKDFIIVEAGDEMGGRIKTDYLADIIN